MPRPRKSDALRLRTERQSLLLSGAAGVFLDRGFYATSMDDVAAAIGVTKVVLYRFFATKDALMAAILTQGLRDIEEADRLWFEVTPQSGGGLLGALEQIRAAGPAPLLVMQFAARDPQYCSFYDLATETSRQRTSERLSVWLGRDPGFHPMWEPIVIQVADFSLNGFMRWLESGQAVRDRDFERWMIAALRALSAAASATMIGQDSISDKHSEGGRLEKTA